MALGSPFRPYGSSPYSPFQYGANSPLAGSGTPRNQQTLGQGLGSSQAPAAETIPASYDVTPQQDLDYGRILSADPTQRVAPETRQAVTERTALEKTTPLGNISAPAYDQFILQQARLESEGKVAGEAKAQREAELAAQRQAQEALQRLQGEQRQAEMRLQESLMGEREQRRIGAIPGLLSSVPGLDESQYATGAADEGEEAASQAAYTRAREQAGASGLSAIRALRELMAGQGLTGSTVEAAGLGNVIGDVRGTVGDVARTQAVQRSQRAGQRADLSKQLALSRRGQDISRQQALQQLILGSIY